MLAGESSRDMKRDMKRSWRRRQAASSARNALRSTGHSWQSSRNARLVIAIYETSRPFTWTLTGDWRLLVYTWPRETISLVDTESQRLTARVLSAGSGVARFLSPMLSGLMDFDVELSATGSARLADEF
jgi:hypothetical protein